MRSDSSETLTTVATEIAWLLGSWAISVGVVGALFGFARMLAGPLDIQLHNTYFRLTTGYAVFPVFVFVATIVTAARGAVGRFRQGSIRAVLAVLALLWGLLLFAIAAVLKNAP